MESFTSQSISNSMLKITILKDLTSSFWMFHRIILIQVVQHVAQQHHTEIRLDRSGGGFFASVCVLDIISLSWLCTHSHMSGRREFVHNKERISCEAISCMCFPPLLMKKALSPFRLLSNKLAKKDITRNGEGHCSFTIPVPRSFKHFSLISS